MKNLHYILFAAIMLLSSCGNKKLAADILKLQSRPIDMTSCESAFCCENGEELNCDSGDSTSRLIVYVDSLSCSPCFISHMLEYMGAVVDLESVGVNTLFIFEPVREQEESIKSSLRQLAYPVRTVVVSNGAFSSDNPHLPSSSVFHSFLVNENNEVTIVGDPARNPKIKELMLDKLKNEKVV